MPPILSVFGYQGKSRIGVCASGEKNVMSAHDTVSRLTGRFVAVGYSKVSAPHPGELGYQKEVATISGAVDVPEITLT